MKSATKVAVVGVGALGKHHARIYSERADVELVAVVDINQERLWQVASACSCPGYENYRDILDHVEAISLAVPTVEHARIGTEFLEKGKHILVEKPVSQTLNEADNLIQAAKKSGAILHVGHSERFNPALLAVRPHIRHPRFFEAHRLGVFVPRSLDIDVVLDLMIHDLDLILYLVESEVQEIRAVGIPVLTQRTDIANARLAFKNGCVANVTASRVSTEMTRKLRFFQAQEYVSLDFSTQELEVHRVKSGDAGMGITEKIFEVTKEEPLKLEVEVFLSAICGKGTAEESPNGCSGEEGKRALSLALEIKNIIEKDSDGRG